MKILYPYIIISFLIIMPLDSAESWKINNIILQNDISDGIVVDLNGDGWQDLLLICGGFINIFFNKQGEFSTFPDQKIFYKELGDYIDVGKMDNVSKRYYLLGLTKEGIKYYELSGTRYRDMGYLIKTKVDLPNNRFGQIFSDFAFDVDGDGIDEIFLLSGNKLMLYKLNNKGLWSVHQIGNPLNQTSFFISQINKANGDIIFKPMINSKFYFIFQYLADNRIVDISELGQLNNYFNSSLYFSNHLLNPEMKKFNIYMDINGDKIADKVNVEIQNNIESVMIPILYAKISIYINKNGFNIKPDYFFKTMIIDDQFPLVDLNGDGNFDIITVWPELSPGSRENMIKLLIESKVTFKFNCYLFDRGDGYQKNPALSIKADVDFNIPYKFSLLPFNASGDYDGDGKKDLLIFKDENNVYVYFLNFKGGKKIKRVELINVKGGYTNYRICDLDGDGKDEILFVKNNKLTIYHYYEK